MAKILVCYYSASGNTRKMAEAVAEGVTTVAGALVELKPVDKVQAENLVNYDGIILGSPTYYGTMAAPIKKLLDESVSIHGRLAGRVGGGFSSSGAVGGGCETTVLDILRAMLVHGMIVQGDSSDSHFGPVAFGPPNDSSKNLCTSLGKRVAILAVKLHG